MPELPEVQTVVDDLVREGCAGPKRFYTGNFPAHRSTLSGLRHPGRTDSRGPAQYSCVPGLSEIPLNHRVLAIVNSVPNSLNHLVKHLKKT